MPCYQRDLALIHDRGYGRGRERHENVLVEVSRIPGLLAAHGVRAVAGTAFGAAELPPGLRAVTGRKD